jgi:3'-5' exoribonuclease
MARLPRIADLSPETAGWGYFLCVRKELRTGRSGEFLALLLQDASGELAGRVFDEVERAHGEFEAGDFVRAEGRVTLFNQQPQLGIVQIRRVHPEQDAAQGFREEDCIASAPRPIDEMWAELQGVLQSIRDPHLRVLLARIAQDHEGQLREWPAAMTVHHAYRGGFLEHVLKIAEVGRGIARAYGANEDLVVAGALLHDIGKLQELSYVPGATAYTRDGNLLGHIAQGLVLVRDATREIAGFPDDLRAHLEHLVLSHHGSREHGSPVEPKTVEAFVLAMADDLDAKINQVRQALREAGGDEEFSGWHRRLGRVLYRGTR